MPEQAPERVPTLEMRHVSKTFPGVKALNDVRLKAWGGEVHALMGENGAGKSTLMKILSGAYQPDSGAEILIDGQKVAITDPIAAKRQGIAIIYQELALAPNLSVAENIYLGSEIHRRGLIDRRSMNDNCRPVLERLGAPFGPETVVGGLSIAEQQLVEIARALHANSKILVLDEPTTALSNRETERLFALVRQLRSDGIALIYISHRMAEVYELSDRVSVLRDGSYVGTLERHEISADALVKMMVGRDLSTFYKKEHDPSAVRGPVVLEVEGITDGGKRVKPISFTLHKGEVLGIAGLVGSGRTELARLIFGADAKTAGEVRIEGQPVHIPDPAARPRSRHRLPDGGPQGRSACSSTCRAARTSTWASTIATPAPAACSTSAWPGRRREAAFKALRVRAASPLVTVGSLSGGNQQKVLLSRWLEIGPKMLILDEPTRGVDIGAKSELYRIIDELAQKGIGIIVISSEMPEIIGICDRVLVMREGPPRGRGRRRDGATDHAGKHHDLRRRARAA